MAEMTEPQSAADYDDRTTAAVKTVLVEIGQVLGSWWRSAGPCPQVEDTNVLGDRSPEQWQQDAFGQVDAWLRALGLRR